MKAINKIWVFALGTAVMVSCSDLDTFPESGIVTEDQKKEVVEDNPERLQADINTLSSIFTKLLPNWAGGSATPFHNDFSYPAVCIATDGNGADMVSDNSDYEWFSVAFEYSDRNANYAVPMFTWNFCYKLNKQANDILATIPADTENQTLIHYRGQALVARAFANFTLAQRFQFTYKGNEDKPTVPIVTWDMPAERAGANPRATNAEIYKLIYDDLTQAIADLEGFQRTSKAAADRNVAYGMRARVNLVMNNWGEAATDAEAALSGYTFLSKDDVSAPGFNSANSPSWIWAGIYKAADTPANYRNITWGGHLCSFARGYTTSQGLYKRINSLLYNMIPDTDVRKGWWINASLESPLLDHMDWDGVTGSAISSLAIPNVKRAFQPYTNVKFAPYENKCGTDINAGDWCIMRAEEMLHPGRGHGHGRQPRRRQVPARELGQDLPRSFVFVRRHDSRGFPERDLVAAPRRVVGRGPCLYRHHASEEEPRAVHDGRQVGLPRCLGVQHRGDGRYPADAYPHRGDQRECGYRPCQG